MQSKIPLTLDDLLVKKVRVKQVKSEIQKVVTSTTVSGVYKIPESDKPFSIFFIDPNPPPKVNLKPKTWKENVYFITALLSKYPHFIYLQSCKVANNPKTYWFKDTSRNITIILTDEEIQRKLK